MNHLWSSNAAAIALCMLLGVSISSAQPEPAVGVLRLTITGFESDEGSARIAIANTGTGFKNDEGLVATLRGELHDGVARVQSLALPFGEYAVKVFHDANGNDKLDTNFLGIPKEAVGFSNGARATLGLPDFEDAKVVLSSDSLSVDISMD